MVECLGAHLLPLLPSALQALLPPSANAADLGDVMALLHQLAVRYKADLGPLIAEVSSTPLVLPSFEAASLQLLAALETLFPTLFHRPSSTAKGWHRKHVCKHSMTSSVQQAVGPAAGN